MTVLIRGGRVIDPSRSIDAFTDIAVIDGKIAVADDLGGGAETIDAAGCWVVPGLIDVHVHLREPGGEQKEEIATGLRAAAAGGFTAVLPMPNTAPPNDSPELTRWMIERARALGGTRLYPVAAATVGRKGLAAGDLRALAAAGAAAFSDDGSCILDDDVMAEVLELCKSIGVPFSQHAEDHGLSRGAPLHDGPVARRLGLDGWPTAAEHRIVARDLELAARIGCRIHVAHVSTREAVGLVREAKRTGVDVTCEVTPHHLLLTDEEAERIGTLAKVNPPLRPRDHVEACVEGLADGTIDIVATDHAPHTEADKGEDFQAAAYGMVGLETAVGLLLELVGPGALTEVRMIDAMSTAPARCFALDGGTLAPGAPADITIIDPHRPYTVDPARFRSKSRNTPFAGRRLPGCAVRTLVGGRTVFDAQ